LKQVIMGCAAASNSVQDPSPLEEKETKEEETTASAANNDVLNKLSKESVALYRHKAKYEVNDDGSVTFWPNPSIKRSHKTLETAKLSMAGAVRHAKCQKLEASSAGNVDVVEFSALHRSSAPICSFIGAALSAWSNHYPFRFKVEQIWILILQGVAVHVDQNAEKLRAKFVSHRGKKTLRVQRDDFVMGSPQNDWEGVIEEFVEQIDANSVEDTAKLFDCDFSGSTMTDRICSKVTVMDVFKNYFDFRVMTLCGFPEITLDGTKADWVRLKQKTSALLSDKVDRQFGAKWGAALIPILNRFIAAFDGEIDCLFWHSMIRRVSSGSGHPDYFCGWFNALFPFDDSGDPNGYCVPYSMDRAYLFSQKRGGGDVQRYPMGLAKAPVVWEYHGKELKLQFVAGFVGYRQDPKTLEICPNLGWCIAH